jgi:hypothetical protein
MEFPHIEPQQKGGLGLQLQEHLPVTSCSDQCPEASIVTEKLTIHPHGLRVIGRSKERYEKERRNENVGCGKPAGGAGTSKLITANRDTRRI